MSGTIETTDQAISRLTGLATKTRDDLAALRGHVETFLSHFANGPLTPAQQAAVDNLANILTGVGASVTATDAEVVAASPPPAP